MSRSISQWGGGKDGTRPAARSATSAETSEEGRSGSAADGATGWERHPLDIDENDIDPAELAEFMSDSPLDAQADPVFKERLRQKLWRIVRDRARGRTDS